MRVICIALGAVALGCSANPDPVLVIGASADVSRLAGEWYGEYSSTESGRAGSIVFALRAGSDSAFGDVLMAAPGVQWNPTTVDVEQTRTEMRPDSPVRVIKVRFVDVEAGEVSGRLEPYTDPNCNCMVNTVFRGRLTADTLAGTYATHLPDAVVQNGRWRVERRKH